MQQPQELLTPRAFYNLFLALSDDYQQNKVPSFLKSTPVQEDVNVQDVPREADWDERPLNVKPKQSTLGAFFSASLDSAKRVAAKVTVKAVHSPLIKFVAEEMEAILREESGPIKKMADMIILFHGLHCYVATVTHSKELRDLLNTLNRKIWMNTQHANIQPQRLMPRGDVENPNEVEDYHEDVPRDRKPELPLNTYTGPKHIVSEADRRQFMTPLENYKAQLRAEIRDVGNLFYLPEQEAFFDRYAVQIQRAYELMCHNTTEVSKADFRENYKFDAIAKYDPNRPALLKDPTACYSLITKYDLWHYRVRDSEDQDPRTTADISAELTQRRNQAGNIDLQGNSLQRAWAYNQIAVELMQPRADMGPSYNPMLASLLLRHDREAFNLPPRLIHEVLVLQREERHADNGPSQDRVIGL